LQPRIIRFERGPPGAKSTAVAELRTGDAAPFRALPGECSRLEREIGKRRPV